MPKKPYEMSLAQHQLDEIFATITELKTQLEFLTVLEPRCRQALPKLHDHSRAFIRRALMTAKKNDEIVPVKFDLKEFERDVLLANRLRMLSNVLTPLFDKLEDSLQIVESDTYRRSLDIYAYAKADGVDHSLVQVLDAMSYEACAGLEASAE